MYEQSIGITQKIETFQLIEDKEWEQKGRIPRLTQWNLGMITKSSLSYNLTRKVKKEKY